MNLLEPFKNYLFSQNDKPTKVTVKNYLSDINRFIYWYEATFIKSFTPKEVAKETIEQYKQDSLLNKSALSPRSLERHLSSLRKFFTFLKHEGLIVRSPFEQPLIGNQKSKIDPWRIKDFKDYLYIYNASRLTIKNYLIDLKQFITWAQEVTTSNETGQAFTDVLAGVNTNLVEEYKQRLLDQDNFSPTTINRKLSSLRKYLNWAEAEGLVSSVREQAAPEIYIPEPKTEEINTKYQILNTKYSSFPPLRITQKVSNAFIFALDSALIIHLAKLVDRIEYALWKTKGQPVFKKVSSIKNQVSSQIPARITMQSIAGGLNTKYQILNTGKISNIPKSFYAPLEISTRFFPWYKKAWITARYTRPKWYKTYHSYPIVHYLHFAVLIIFLSVIGFSFYNTFFAKGNQSPTLAVGLPTAPARILSFQGRLTNNLDTPISTPSALRFAIYNSLTATDSGDLSVMLWQEVDSVTPDQDGIFNVLLGNNTAIPSTLFTQNNALWLGVTVGQTAELTPRQQLATVAFATNSETLQGLLPITAAGATQSNVVLALDSSGNLTIGGTATPTFQASGGQFTLSGKSLLLTTTSGSNTNVTIAPDGLGFIDLQKPFINTTNNGNLAGANGAVEVDDMLAVLATSSGAAFTLNQNGNGDLITASASGITKFRLANTGQITAPYYNTAGCTLKADTSGNIACGAGGAQFWQELAGALSPVTAGDDLLLGSSSTASADFAFTGLMGNQPQASFSGQFIVMANNGWGGKAAIGYNSPGTAALAVNGNVGIGTTTPDSSLVVNGPNTANTIIADFQINNSSRFKINTTNGLTLTAGGAGNGAINTALILGLTGAINITAETVPVQINAPSYTITGSYANQRITRFTQSTITAATALSISTEADTVNIAGAPISAGSATIANSIGLRISSGTSIASGVTNGYGLYVDAPTGASNNYAAVFPTGNVGIGTTSPAALAHVYKGASGQATPFGGSNLIVESNTTNYLSLLTPNANESGILFGDVASNVDEFITGKNATGMRFGTGGTEKVRIDSSGNVGIGTTAPTALFDVAGAASVGGQFKFRSGTAQVQATADQTLTLGGDTTGQVVLSGFNGAVNGVALSGYNTCTLKTDGSGVVNCGTDLTGGSGVNFWQELIGATSLINTKSDLLIGGSTTASAKFAFTGLMGSQTQASFSGQLIVMPNNGYGGGIQLGATINNNNVLNTIAQSGAPSGNLYWGNRQLVDSINIGSFGVSSVTNSDSTLTISPTTGAVIASLNLTHANSWSGAQTFTATTNFPGSGIWNTNGSVGIGTTAVGNGQFVVNQLNSTGDIFTASLSGTTKFTISNAGAITSQAYLNAGGVLYTSTTGLIGQSAAGTASQCLIGGTTPSWSSCATAASNFWQRNIGALSPITSSDDLLLGSNATTTAKFAFINMNGSGSPTASISGNLSLVVPTGSNPLAKLNILNGGSLNIQTSVGGDGVVTSALYIANNGNVGIGNSNPQAKLDIGGATSTISNTSGNITITPTGNLVLVTTSTNGVLIGSSANTLAPLSISGGIGNNAALIINQLNSGDLFTASASGTTKFTISNTGALTSAAYTAQNGVLFGTQTTGLIAQATTASTGLCLTSGASSPSWSSCATAASNFWQRNAGALSPLTSSDDLLLGGSSTTSADFAFTGMMGSQTQASFSGQFVLMPNNGYGGNASVSGNLTLGAFAASSLQTTKNQLLTIGGNTTGDIQFKPGNSASSLYLASSGNVGVGITTPGNLLTVGSSSQFSVNNTGVVNVTNAASGTPTGYIQLNQAGYSSGTLQDHYGALRLSLNAANANIGGSGSQYIASNVANQLSLDSGDFLFNVAVSGTAGNLITWNTALDIKNSGSVGIGTTSPTALLDIAGAASVGGVLKFRSGTAQIQSTADQTLTLGGDTTGQVVLSGFNGAVNGITFAGYTTAGCTLKTTAAGVVTCGTDLTNTSPNFWQELTGALSPVTASDDLLLGGSTTASAKFAFTGLMGSQTQASFSGQLIVMPNNGYGGNASISGNLTLGAFAASSLQTTNNRLLTIGGNTTGDIQFKPGNSSSSLYLASNGNAGIGTTAPVATLDLRGNSATTPIASFSGSTNFAGLVVDNSGNGDLITASSSAHGGSNPARTEFKVTNSGNVYGRAWTDLDNSSYFMDLNAAGTSLVTAGNVGIGTLTPLSKLDVNGGVAIGSYAGTSAAPSNGLIVSGNVGIGGTTVVLKSVQSGTTTLASANSSTTVTITSVDTTKAFLVFSTSFNDASPGISQVTGQITNGTTLTFARISTGANIAIKWYVAEFTSGVTVQRGNITNDATSKDITLTAVDTAKAFPIISYRNTGSLYNNDDYVKAKITSSTNLNLSMSAATTGITEWQVVQFADANVQTGDISYVGADASKTATIAPVDTSKTWLLFSYTNDNVSSTSQGDRQFRGRVTAANTLTFDRDTTAAALSGTITWYAVQFTNNTSVQSGSQNFGTGDTVKNATITAVDTTKSIAAAGGMYHRGGKTTYIADDNPGVATTTLDLTSSTNLQMTRGVTGSSTADVGWFVVQFPTTAGPVSPLANLGVLGNLAVGATYGNLAAPASGAIFEGSVGIGTTSPDAPLQVSNLSGGTTNSLFTTHDYVGGSAGSALEIDFGAASGNTYSRLSAVTTGNTVWGNLILQSAAGNVGIGTTSPGYTLDVNGTIRAGSSALLCTNCAAGYYQDTSNGAYRSLGVAGDTGYYFQNNGGSATTMYIGLQGSYNGVVGIGTSTPWTNVLLDVAGGIRAQGYMWVSQYLNVGALTGDSPGASLCKRSYDNFIGTCSSLREFKDNITPLDLGLDTLMKLQPVTFDWKQPAGSNTVYHDLGFVAEDVAAINPLLAQYDNGKLVSVKYDKMAALIVKSIQQQQVQIASLSANFANLAPVAMTDAGNLSLVDQTATDSALTVPHYFTLNDALGNPISRVGAFAELAVANLRAGGINAQQITTNALSVATDNVTINGQSLRDYITSVVSDVISNSQFTLSNGQTIISPLASIDTLKTNIISPLADNSNISVKFDNSKFQILNTKYASGSAVASIDNQGNATFSGSLTANNLTIQQLNNSGDATISGTLHAGRILASDIVGLASNSATYVTNNVMNVYNSTSSANSNFGLIANAATPSTNGGLLNTNYQIPNTGTYMNISSYSGQLAYVDNLGAANAAFSQNLMVFGLTSLSDTSIVGQLSIGGNMILANDSINVLGSDLNLQPLRQGGLSVMGGLFTIDTNGNVKVGGDAEFAKNVTVKGTLSANIISPLPGSDLTVGLSDKSKLVVNNSSNSAILAINQVGDLVASGAATFSKLNLGLIQPAFALSPTELVATGSAGTANVSAYQTQVTINNPSVTDKSLIYITPTSSTNNQVLYLLKQVPGTSFTVGLQNPSANAIPFNWIIVN